MSFLRDVCQHIVESCFIHRELTARYEAVQAAAQGYKDRGKKFNSSSYPEQSARKQFHPHAGLANYKALALNNHNASSLERFFQGLCVVEVQDKSMRPIAWLEFFVLYLLWFMSLDEFLCSLMVLSESKYFPD